MKVSKKLLKLISDSLDEAVDEMLTESNWREYYTAAPDFWPEEARKLWDWTHEVAHQGMKKIEERIDKS